MNNNFLLVFSVLMVFAILIVVNYNAINDFYKFSVPLNSLELSKDFQDTSEQFEKIKNLESSTCFTTPSMNEFCYEKPRMQGKTGTSYLVGNNIGFDGGHMHFDKVNPGTSWFTIKNIKEMENDSVLITFGDRDGKVTGSFFTSSEDFEFIATVNKFDTFVSHCNKEDGTNVRVVQYLGIQTIDDVDFFVTWHTSGNLQTPIVCEYPEIIQHSMNHDFGI